MNTELRYPTLTVVDEHRGLRTLPLYDSGRRWRANRIYRVVFAPDGARLAFDRDYRLVGAVQATREEWDTALLYATRAAIHDPRRPAYDQVWFDIALPAKEARAAIARVIASEKRKGRANRMNRHEEDKGDRRVLPDSSGSSTRTVAH